MWIWFFLRRVAPLLNDTELTDFLQSSKDKLKLLGCDKSAFFCETERDSIELPAPTWSFLQCKEEVSGQDRSFWQCQDNQDNV